MQICQRGDALVPKYTIQADGFLKHYLYYREDYRVVFRWKAALDAKCKTYQKPCLLIILNPASILMEQHTSCVVFLTEVSDRAPGLRLYCFRTFPLSRTTAQDLI